LSGRRVLVVGLEPHSAGKTTLCKALIYGFKDRGLDLVPFKPHSGISYWSQFDTFQESLMRGSLLSSDIIELGDAAKSNLPLDILNPVNRLSGPILDRGMPEEKLVFREFLAQRFTYHDGINHRNVYYLNGTVKLTHMRDMEQFYLKIRKQAAKVVFAKNFQELVQAYADNFDKATSSCYRYLRDRPLLVESFNDAAYPFNDAGNCDAVLCVCSSIVMEFAAGEYLKAIELCGRQKSKLQLTVSDIYRSSLVERQYRIDPLASQERSDPARLVRNYSRIIDDLLED
jgi:predicted P-loop ATPase/GTPase